jgi:hypothetical protein
MNNNLIDKINFNQDSNSSLNFHVNGEAFPNGKTISFQCAIAVDDIPSIVLLYDSEMTEEFLNSHDISLIINQRFITIQINQKAYHLIGFNDEFINLANNKKQLYIQVNDENQKAIDGILFDTGL